MIGFHGILLQPQIAMVMDLASRGSLFDVLVNPKNRIDWTMFFKFANDIVKAIYSLHTWDPCVVHR